MVDDGSVYGEEGTGRHGQVLQSQFGCRGKDEVDDTVTVAKVMVKAEGHTVLDRYFAEYFFKAVHQLAVSRYDPLDCRRLAAHIGHCGKGARKGLDSSVAW